MPYVQRLIKVTDALIHAQEVFSKGIDLVRYCTMKIVVKVYKSWMIVLI